jgi:hypothetical protein
MRIRNSHVLSSTCKCVDNLEIFKISHTVSRKSTTGYLTSSTFIFTLVFGKSLVPLIFDLIQSNQSLPELSFLDIEVKTRVRRYQRGNLNPYIEEEQNIQWPKEKVQKDEQRSTRHTHKTKDDVTRTTLKTPVEIAVKLYCSQL